MSDQPDDRARTRILICEDEIMLARDMARTLRCLGFEVAGTAATGAQAVRATQETKPDLILMDINLEGELDGIETAEQIRRCFDIPVVYLTAYAEKDVLERAKKTEPYGYLSKPAGLSDLRSTVETALYKHEADKRVRRSEEQFRLLAETSEAIFWEYDILLDRFTYVAPQVERILGFSPEEWTNLQFWVDHIHEEDREQASQYCRDSTTRGDSHQFEYRFLAKDGRIVWLRDVVSVEMIDKVPVRLRGLLLDITERMTAEEALRRSEARFRRISSLTSDIAYSCHKPPEDDYTLDWVTGAVERITGYSPDEVKAMKCWRCLVIDEDLPFFDKYVIGLAPSQNGTCELRLSTKTGGLVWVDSFAECVLDPISEDSMRLYGALVDITERKMAEEKIKEQKEFLDTVIESLSHPFYVINVNDYTIEKANSAAILSGTKTNSTCYHITHQRDMPCGRTDHLCPIAEVGKTGLPVTVEHIHHDDKGDVRNVEVHCFPISDDKGSVARVIVYTLDVTDRKKAQEALVQTEKFRAVVDLTSGVAHNFNNLLQIVMGNASLGLLNLQAREFGELKERLDQIIQSSKFGAETVRRLNRYAGERAVGLTPPRRKPSICQSWSGRQWK